jgi:hypothetical protein
LSAPCFLLTASQTQLYLPSTAGHYLPVFICSRREYLDFALNHGPGFASVQACIGKFQLGPQMLHIDHHNTQEPDWNLPEGPAVDIGPEFGK